MIASSRSGRGYSLIEAILASFLMVFVFFIVSRLFHSGFQISRQVESRMAAVRFAEKRMMAVRRWAKTTRTWTGPPATVTSPTDAEFPGHTVVVEFEDVDTLSPCRELEQAFGANNQRNLPTVAKQVIVRVSKPGTPDFVMSGQVTKMEADWGNTADLRITPSTATITGMTTPVEFEVVAYDDAGVIDRDVLFHWEVEPVFDLGNPSTADVRLNTRDGRSVLVYNRVRKRSTVYIPQDGFCRLIAYVKYRGAIRRGQSGVITLVAP